MSDHQKKFKKLIEKNRVDFLLIWSIIFFSSELQSIKRAREKIEKSKKFGCLTEHEYKKLSLFLDKQQARFLDKIFDDECLF